MAAAPAATPAAAEKTWAGVAAGPKAAPTKAPNQVTAPVAVRYAWSNLPLGSLMNARELPAYPFRSDDWPLIPHQSQGAYERR